MPAAAAPFTSPLAEALAGDVLDRLLRYARIDTQSRRGLERSPSTPGQLELARLLVAELSALGLHDAGLDEDGFVMATLPATAPGAPVIGLLAHVDVSPDAPAAGVEPLVHRRYDGGLLELPRGGTRLDPELMPELPARAGHDIVTGSGDTLLGADDKAGVAEIMAAIAHLAAHPELPRPTLRIGFTPDEEIGAGGGRFDLERFGASCAYTLDGSEPGELQDETFAAVEVTMTVHGVNVHPGLAKDRLVNALRLAGRILAALPADRAPETTTGRDGFIHPYGAEGGAGQATVRLIVRDFEEERLDDLVGRLRRIAEDVVATAPRARLETTVRRQYSNMRRHLDERPEVCTAAEEAIRREGLNPRRVPIRGGTDGAILSARGLPTPNLFTGGHEFHSTREWASVQEMAAAAAVVVRLAGVWADDTWDGGAGRPS